MTAQEYSINDLGQYVSEFYVEFQSEYVKLR